MQRIVEEIKKNCINLDISSIAEYKNIEIIPCHLPKEIYSLLINFEDEKFILLNLALSRSLGMIVAAHGVGRLILNPEFRKSLVSERTFTRPTAADLVASKFAYYSLNLNGDISDHLEMIKPVGSY